MKQFAKALIAISFGLLGAFGPGGSAVAAPADRGGDAVVLKGDQLPGLLGTGTNRVIGYKWTGKWTQVPVQIDERHTVDVRQLYPSGNHPPYVGNDDPDFDVEVYSDPKTRSGADPETGLDSNDELVFMARDTGNKAPARAGAPALARPGSALAVKVRDPAGGGQAWLYLFHSRGQVDQSAGKDYVEYDFKLTDLVAGQNLKDDYKYFTSGGNTEDSTVTTDAYQLHSWDRWQEDEMRITAGGADGTDILDREVAQATLTGCGRTEFTFSGRWTEDLWAGNDGATDDEGTYVTVIDGPVRAIRSYMGANSGPYVQREHIYYRNFEQNTIFLRVHLMLDLYSGTGYAPSAIGMTYRDAKNPDGVPVDGQPDTLVPTTTADVVNGAYSWQQLSGPQGTVSTVVGTETDIPNPNFGNYYLDEESPGGGNQTQCGGDGKSIGASGFGILGPVTPNTDPRLGAFNNLSVERIRYFGSPSEGAEQAARYADRVSKPLTGSASAQPMKKPEIGVRVNWLNRKVKVRPGRKVPVRIRVRNNGNVPVDWSRLCVKSRNFVRPICQKTGRIAIGKVRNLKFNPRVRARAKGKQRIGFYYSQKGKAGDWGFNSGASGYKIRLKR